MSGAKLLDLSDSAMLKMMDLIYNKLHKILINMFFNVSIYCLINVLNNN